MRETRTLLCSGLLRSALLYEYSASVPFCHRTEAFDIDKACFLVQMSCSIYAPVNHYTVPKLEFSLLFCDIEMVHESSPPPNSRYMSMYASRRAGSSTINATGFSVAATALRVKRRRRRLDPSPRTGTAPVSEKSAATGHACIESGIPRTPPFAHLRSTERSNYTESFNGVEKDMAVGFPAKVTSLSVRQTTPNDDCIGWR